MNLGDAFDVEYHPHAEGHEWVRAFSPVSVLVLGRPTDKDAADIGRLGIDDARGAPAKESREVLHNGTYALIDRGEWHVLWVTQAQSPKEASRAQGTFATTHLGEAHHARRVNWTLARELVGASPFEIGGLVRPLSMTTWGTVKQVERTVGGHVVQVEIGGRLQTFNEDDLESIEGDPRDPGVWIQHPPASARDIALTLSFSKLDTPLSDTLYSFAATKTKFRPYQFVPVLKVLGNPQGRLLIADEVGLGKTIEAGLVWTELALRQRIHRGLVVVPASLKSKWQKEMSYRFGVELTELKLNDLRKFIADLKQDKDPGLIGVISLESLRSDEEVLTGLTEMGVRFDIVIVDEAHALRNRATKSFFAGETLSDLAETLIFLSATPLNLKTDDLFNLLSLLDTEGFPDKAIFEEQLEPNEYLNEINRLVADSAPGAAARTMELMARIATSTFGRSIAQRPDYRKLEQTLSQSFPLDPDSISRVRRLTGGLNSLGSVFTRTRKADVPEPKALREVEAIEVEWTAQERALYDAVYAHSFERAKLKRIPLGFALQMPLRQACSSLVVMQQRLAKKEDWDLWVSEEITEGDLQYEAADDADEISAAALAPAPSRSAILRTVLPYDSKLDALKKRLRMAKEANLGQALIFTFFRGTVEYLARELGREFSVKVLHGGVPNADRDEIIDDFRKEKFEILVANQVGAEGLDFEFCNVLVNYDLPWNPMQVEQRIGRLDRFGQKHEKIFIFNMYTPGTIESEIFGRLYERIGVFEKSIGELEPILRNSFPRLNSQMLDPMLTEEQRKAKEDAFLVQTETERAQIEELEKNRGNLALTGMLDIKGLTDSGPSDGRYIGEAELFHFLEYITELHGGELRMHPDRTVELRGTQSLGAEVAYLDTDQVVSAAAKRRVASQLHAASPFILTFDPETASDRGIELVNAGHPLVRAAVASLRQSRNELPRFGHLRLPSLAPGQHILASVDLIRAEGGLIEGSELWVTAVDMESMERVPRVGDSLLLALAQGQILEAAHDTEALLAPALLSVRREVSRRLNLERSERQDENQALVETRITSFSQSISIKLARLRDGLDKIISSKKSERVVPMWRAKISHLERDLAGVSRRFQPKFNMTLSQEAIALVVISG